MALMASPWHALRPVLLAGAAAVTWLTLSSTAASADAGPDSSSLPGTVGSSISALTHNAVDAVQPSAAEAGASQGLLQPAVSQISASADNLVASVPVMDQVVPAEIVSSVLAPVAAAADAVAEGVVDVAVVPVAEAVPVLEPVLQPVSDVLTGSAPSPLPLPGSPLDAVGAQLPDAAPAQHLPPALHTPAETGQTLPEQGAPAVPIPTAAGSNVEQGSVGLLAETSTRSAAVSAAVTDPVAEQPLVFDPGVPPAQAPAAPGSGTGSGSSSGGPSGAAAWLSPFDFGYERSGVDLVGDVPEHAPAPVSFDPGSSPD